MPQVLAPTDGGNGKLKMRVRVSVDPAGQCRPGGNMNPGAVQAHDHVLSR